MVIKKDPGKFTLRFNLSDPRQQKAVEALNMQGRMKAQFLTNAILSYMERSALSTEQENVEKVLERVIKQMLKSNSATEDIKKEQELYGELFNANSLAAITGTLQAFRE